MAGNTALELEKFLPYRLSVLSNTVSQAIAREYEDRFQLSITEWRVVAVLGRYDGLSAREVAERTAMDKVAVSRAVAELMKDRRVKRSTADHDKRQSVLSLTAKGRKAYSEVAPLALAHERRLLAHLDAEERESLGRIIEKLLAAEKALNYLLAPLCKPHSKVMPQPGSKPGKPRRIG
ncbi:MarR family winged helix-turn-helix transcriptional regulator [Tahibacter sp.]|uniref:MarR family winged helix-turn-helix transcriptional regulator n=1 Tax=Tahibacter sp. TaxID=2056211 RepID=UPI0028C397C0|nr:MarR family winged helix-turn-helix transcriptional regulator [Tahibacter sp.]